MGLKTKWNRFWTLRNSEGGFTLVELVVVIAILAILAGVTVPAYTSYIEKAEQAADMALAQGVSVAFLAACGENGVDGDNVQAASISLNNGAVFGLSTFEMVTPVEDVDIDVISDDFDAYYADNEGTVFKTEGARSLLWNTATQSFEISTTGVATRVRLSNGNVFTVDPEVMAQIEASAYAGMGYGEIAEMITQVSTANEDLVGVCQTLGMDDRFAAVLVANGLIADASAADSMDAATMTNGLQMVTAKHLTNLNEQGLSDLASMQLSTTLLGQDLGTYGLLANLADGDGGTAIVSAVATQYALAQAFAQSSSAESFEGLSGSRKVCTGTNSWGVPQFTTMTYNCSSVTDFLNSPVAQADPVWALQQIQGTGSYAAYTETDAYDDDLAGFAATMSLLGDNVGTVTSPGAVDINSYFEDGIYSQDAEDALTQILGQ